MAIFALGGVCVCVCVCMCMLAINVVRSGTSWMNMGSGFLLHFSCGGLTWVVTLHAAWRQRRSLAFALELRIRGFHPVLQVSASSRVRVSWGTSRLGTACMDRDICDTSCHVYTGVPLNGAPCNIVI